MTQTENFFRLDDLTSGIKRQLGEGLDARIFVGEQAMLSVVTVAPFAEGKIHSHPQEQWGLMLDGDGVRIQSGGEIPVKAGDFWRTPGNISHGLRAGPNGARVLDIFSPPREEYRKAGSGFGV
jgi:quercetin dioxygenase-like cupin family protein